MAQAKQGDEVKVHYTGKLDDGTVFDSSEGRDPLQFKIGEGQVIPGFEEGVIGMNIGEAKTISIPSHQAYGPHHDEMVIAVDKSQFPDGMNPGIGDQFQMQHPSGQVILVTVVDVSDADVTLDANHPLAGKDLTFNVELVEVV